jgi:transposase InsO family protein
VGPIKYYGQQFLRQRIRVSHKAGTPNIFNTDQGAQFTSEAFTGVLKHHGIKISMDGKGRWMDNVLYENVYLYDYAEVYHADMQKAA